jgi:hypothetical protein
MVWVGGMPETETVSGRRLPVRRAHVRFVILCGIARAKRLHA